MILYVDSSAFLRRYLSRSGSAETDEVMSNAERLRTSAVTRVEVVGSLTRLGAGGAISKQSARDALAAFEHDLLGIGQVSVTPSVIQSAYELAQRRALKAYDALHLASAAAWQLAQDDRVTVATFDDQLWGAATAEGLDAWPPDPSLFKINPRAPVS